jgi:hypothetical protein
MGERPLLNSHMLKCFNYSSSPSLPHPFCNLTTSAMKSVFIRVVTSLKIDNLPVFYYPSESEIWYDNRDSLLWEGSYKRGATAALMFYENIFFFTGDNSISDISQIMLKCFN